MVNEVPEINPLNEDGTPKSAKQLEKEAKKAAKLAKFNEKQAKAASNKTAVKEKKPPKKEEVNIFLCIVSVILV